MIGSAANNMQYHTKAHSYLEQDLSAQFRFLEKYDSIFSSHSSITILISELKPAVINKCVPTHGFLCGWRLSNETDKHLQATSQIISVFRKQKSLQYINLDLTERAAEKETLKLRSLFGVGRLRFVNQKTSLM
jgi:hypothetical protein